MPIKQQLSFETLQRANKMRNKFWDKNGALDLSFRGVEFAGEAGEASEAVMNLLGYTSAMAAAGGKVCNVIKKLERERHGIAGSRASLDHLGSELADTIITAFLIAMETNIDLADHVACKFNETSAKMKLPIFIGAGDIVVDNSLEGEGV